jgi:hypothetical protein
MKMNILRGLSVFALTLTAIVTACGGDGPSAAPTDTGQSCTAADQCYAGLDGGAIVGTAICLNKVPGGYCTHSCATDADCCAVPGECSGELREVCGPFESTGQMDCFLSCEDTDLEQAKYTDSNAYCAHFANSTFICRSTGGGAKNRKVCVPN